MKKSLKDASLASLGLVSESESEREKKFKKKLLSIWGSKVEDEGVIVEAYREIGRNGNG